MDWNNFLNYFADRPLLEVTGENWLQLLKEKMAALDWKSVKNDVLPFIEFQDDLLSFTRENLLSLL